MFSHNTFFLTSCFLVFPLPECNRSANDSIANVSTEGMVTCKLGYEYKGNQPVCIGNNTILPCTGKRGYCVYKRVSCKAALAQRERILGSLRLKQTVAYH